MNTDKIRAYLGFALRAGKLALGINAVQATKGKIFLLVADEGASPNSKKQIEQIHTRFGCPILWVEDLEGLTGKPFCKLAAMREENLARAVMSEAEK